MVLTKTITRELFSNWRVWKRVNVVEIIFGKANFRYCQMIGIVPYGNTVRCAILMF
ncbi:hypothetical protein [Siminovitchia terrae]|uniref:hypothetical protein n=1 Tax=Siminovitchia terrae TaxID=1914933 RepID=UPI00163D2D5F|nr:hypothetical protein [Siminovitchia terrae]